MESPRPAPTACGSSPPPVEEHPWRLLLEHSPVPAALLDERATVLWVNAALVSFLGRPPSLLVGCPWVSLAPPQERKGEELLVAKAPAARTDPPWPPPRHGNRRYLLPDGTPVHADLLLTTIPRAKATALRVVQIVPRSGPSGPDAPGETEGSYRRMAERWEIATESGDVGIYDLDTRSRRVHYSAGYLRNLGYAPGEWTDNQEEWLRRLHPEDLPAILALDTALGEGGTDRVAIEYRMRHKDGSWRWILDRARVTQRGPEGLPLRLTGIHLDVTAQRQAKSDLATAHRKMQLAASVAGIGFWDYDILSDLQQWDDEMLRLYGISREEFSADAIAWSSRVHPEDIGQAEETMRQSWESGEEVVAQEFRILHPDGEVRHLRSTCLLRRDACGRPLGMLGVNVDITDRRRAEREAQEALRREQELEDRQRRRLESKLKTSLAAAAVAHEINQPLSLIQLHCQMALAPIEANPGPTGSRPRDEDLVAALRTVSMEAERLISTVEKMRMLLRNVQTELQPLDLGDVVNSAVLYLMPRLAAAGIELHRSGLSQPLPIAGDASQLQIAVSNLLRNAIEALEHRSGEGAHISVQARRRGREVELRVGDSGPGFRGGEQEAMPLSSSKPQGTGIGLYVVKTTMENHRGAMGFGTSPLGGAEVLLRFPAFTGDPSGPPAEPERNPHAAPDHPPPSAPRSRATS